MLKRRTPPMVVLMDLLLMLIFVLMLRPTEPSYTLELPPQLDNWDNIKIAYQQAGRKHWLHNTPLPLDDYSFNWSGCPEQAHQWLPNTAETCTIHFHGALAKQITRILFQACLADQCGNIIIPLEADGTIVPHRFITLNPTLRKNPYFAAW